MDTTFPIKVITNPNKIIIGHNIKFDIKFLEQHFKVKHKCKLYDTGIMHSLLDENSNDNELKQLAATYTILGHYDDNIEVTNLKNEPYSKVILYNCLDSIAPLMLFEQFYPKLKAEGLIGIFEFVSEMLSIFVDIEQNGVYVDTNKLYSLYQKHTLITESIKQKHIRTKLSSDTQVREIVYKHFKCPVLEYTKGQLPSTSKDALTSLLGDERVSEEAKNFIDDVLTFRLSNKLITDHLPRIANNLVNNRFYSSYNLAKAYDESGTNRGTVTGRLSSSPNIQNIPTAANIREIFIVSPDYEYFVTGDYSQIELRVAAFLSREPNFLKAFEEGKDVHTALLASIQNIDYDYIMEALDNENNPEHIKWKDFRHGIKRVNFGILYGVGAKRLTQVIRRELKGRIAENVVGNIITKWYSQNIVLMQWLTTVEDSIIKNGFYKTIFGRIRHLAGGNRRTEGGKRILRQGINFPIQSAASDICLLGIKNLYERFERINKFPEKHHSRLLMTVHDEISFETRIKDQDTIKQLMTGAMITDVYSDMFNRFGIQFDVPLEVDIKIDKHWAK